MIKEKRNTKAGRVQLSTLKPGDIFRIGEQNFKILDITNEGYLCIADALDDYMEFDSDCNMWQTSSLRSYLNNDFLKMLAEAIGENNIIPFMRVLHTLDGQTKYGICEDKISILTVDECKKYKKYIVDKKCVGDLWWLLSAPHNEIRTSVPIVYWNGDISSDICFEYNGVRPICTLKSNIFVSPGTQNKTGIKSLGVGELFELAGITWKVLDISDKGYMCLADKLDEPMEFDSKSNDWKISELREFLNKDFYKALAENVGENNIIPFHRDLLSMDGQTEFGDCEDNVSLLTVDEYRKYRGLIPNTDEYWWWLISPWSTPCNDYKTSVTVVSPSGYFDYNCCDDDDGVRPFCIFASAVFES